VNNDAKPLNDKVLHDKLDIQDTGCSFLVARYSLLVTRCSLLVVDKSNSVASSQNRRIYPPVLWRTSLLFLIIMMEYLPARASQWQAGLILTSNE
jgi:hypothetical protein